MEQYFAIGGYTSKNYDTSNDVWGNLLHAQDAQNGEFIMKSLSGDTAHFQYSKGMESPYKNLMM